MACRGFFAIMEFTAAWFHRFYPSLPESERPKKIAEIEKWCQDRSCEIVSGAVGRLAHLSRPPEALFVRGNHALLELFSIAVVGTRHPSSHGLATAARFGKELASAGAVVTSGLARGIDAAAHRGALLAGGYTVAVLGHGLDRIYPSFHGWLAEAIVQSGGALVSEYPPGVPPLPAHFPERNRIIAGLSAGTLVVEAAPKSGSLITARLALEENREVFVVPSRWDEASYAGGHRLIQEGAKLVLERDDILNEFTFASVDSSPPVETPSDLARWLENDTEPVTLATLQVRSGLSMADLLVLLEESKDRGEIFEVSPQRYLGMQSSVFSPCSLPNG